MCTHACLAAQARRQGDHARHRRHRRARLRGATTAAAALISALMRALYSTCTKSTIDLYGG
jgi:hypothetical protein